jgi:hypothetical protein
VLVLSQRPATVIADRIEAAEIGDVAEVLVAEEVPAAEAQVAEVRISSARSMARTITGAMKSGARPTKNCNAFLQVNTPMVNRRLLGKIALAPVR